MGKHKDTGLNSIFARTEPPTPQADPTPAAPPWPEDNSDLDAGNIRANGVGLREGEITALDYIGERFDLARNALIRLAVRRLILDYRAGMVDLAGMAEDKPPRREPKRRLRLPR